MPCPEIEAFDFLIRVIFFQKKKRRDKEETKRRDKERRESQMNQLEPKQKEEKEVIYEVNLVIQSEIISEYKSWLEHHIGEILKIDGFLGARLFQRNPADEGAPADLNHVYWTVQYRLINRQAIENYLASYATQMRQDGIDRFGCRFSASRRILCLVANF